MTFWIEWRFFSDRDFAFLLGREHLIVPGHRMALEGCLSEVRVGITNARQRESVHTGIHSFRLSIVISMCFNLLRDLEIMK